MAYNTKYRFRFESCHGVVYEVRLLENGYSGSITDRPLGRAPVIRMQEADPFRPTSCELTLECRTDGEYVDLYTTDPMQYKVEVYHKRGASSFSIIWDGYVATEIYSEPDIAPPYDVKITATDGLGILKEYTFEPVGMQSVRSHIVDLLQMTGDAHPNVYMASRLREYGETDNDFLDVVSINLDYMAGKTCYEVLGELLKSMRCVITYRYYWLIIREVDVQISSAGVVNVLAFSDDPDYATADDTLTLGKKVGKMGGTNTDMWPNGYLTRRVVPAKKSVKVTADWNLVDGSPDLEDWYSQDEATTGAPPRYIGNMGGTGALYAQMAMTNFLTDVKVTVKCWRGSVWQSYNGAPYVKVLATWQSSGGGGMKYYHPDTGWTTTSPATGEDHPVERTNSRSDPSLAEEISVTIPSPSDSSSGALYIYVVGHLVAVWDVDVELVTMKGYEDTILIDNGSRGAADDLSITGGREIDSFLISAFFAQGVWTNPDSQTIITAFSDGSWINRDWMSLTALAYAKQHAAPRIEITGKLDNPYASPMLLPPMFIQSHGVWALLSTYDWDLLNEDIDFKAVTLPTATLAVDSETITTK